jgi:hypothetical protein
VTPANNQGFGYNKWRRQPGQPVVEVERARLERSRAGAVPKQAVIEGSVDAAAGCAAAGEGALAVSIRAVGLIGRPICAVLSPAVESAGSVRGGCPCAPRNF